MFTPILTNTFENVLNSYWKNWVIKDRMIIYKKFANIMFPTMMLVTFLNFFRLVYSGLE
jgi:hypothetical protein